MNPAPPAPPPTPPPFGPGLRFLEAAVGPGPPGCPLPMAEAPPPAPELLPLRLRRLLTGLCDSKKVHIKKVVC